MARANVDDARRALLTSEQAFLQLRSRAITRIELTEEPPERGI